MAGIGSGAGFWLSHIVTLSDVYPGLEGAVLKCSNRTAGTFPFLAAAASQPSTPSPGLRAAWTPYPLPITPRTPHPHPSPMSGVYAPLTHLPLAPAPCPVRGAWTLHATTPGHPLVQCQGCMRPRPLPTPTHRPPTIPHPSAHQPRPTALPSCVRGACTPELTPTPVPPSSTSPPSCGRAARTSELTSAPTHPPPPPILLWQGCMHT